MRMMRRSLSPLLARHALASPAVLPDLLADHAGDPRLLLGHRHHRPPGRSVSDLEQEFGADRILELFTILDWHHESAGPSDHAILVVPIEVVDIHRRIRRFLYHDR